jgi:hypothetical protein
MVVVVVAQAIMAAVGLLAVVMLQAVAVGEAHSLLPVQLILEV